MPARDHTHVARQAPFPAASSAVRAAAATVGDSGRTVGQLGARRDSDMAW